MAPAAPSPPRSRPVWRAECPWRTRWQRRRLTSRRRCGGPTPSAAATGPYTTSGGGGERRTGPEKRAAPIKSGPVSPPPYIIRDLEEASAFHIQAYPPPRNPSTVCSPDPVQVWLTLAGRFGMAERPSRLTASSAGATLALNRIGQRELGALRFDRDRPG